jgi:hypothetical protein
MRSMTGVNYRTSCKQLFKEIKILTLASLYVLEVTCFTCITQHCQLNSNVRKYKTRRKMDIKLTYKKDIINMGNKLYN